MEINIFQFIIIIILFLIFFIYLYPSFVSDDVVIITDRYNKLLLKYNLVLQERDEIYDLYIKLNNKINNQENIKINQENIKIIDNINIYDNQIGSKTSTHTSSIIPRHIATTDNEILKYFF
jgi:hypothetical protein